MKNILILGSSSLISKSFIDIVDKELYIIYAASRTNSNNEKINHLSWNIYMHDKDDFVKSLPDIIDCIIVAAWDGNSREYRNNHEINMNCANYIYSQLSLICENKDVKQIILFGSQAEYGIASGVVNEEYIIDFSTLSAYGKAKLWLYNQLKKNKICNSITEIRFNNVYGYCQNKSQLLLEVIKKISNNEKFVFYSDCSQYLDYLYVSDAACAVIDAIKYNLEGIYNVGSSEVRTLKEFMEILANKMKVINYVEYGNKREKPGFIFDSNKFRNLTGWNDEIRFSDGIDKVIKCLNK